MRRAAAAALVLAITIAMACPSGGGRQEPRAANLSVPPTAGDSFEPVLGLPATEVVAFGVSPGEAPEEAWAYGRIGDKPVSVEGGSFSSQYALLKHTGADSSPWQVVPLPAGVTGTPSEYGAFAGQSTPNGGVVLLSGSSVVVRDPGERPRLVPVPEATQKSPTAGAAGAGVLAPGETLLSPHGYAAIEEADARTGLLIAPQNDGVPGHSEDVPTVAPGVLHYDGHSWTREPIESPAVGERHFLVLALACSPTASTPSCWLLASVLVPTSNGLTTALLLFQRSAQTGQSAGYDWKPVQIADRFLGERQGSTSLTPVAALEGGAQMLTATSQGVWVDFRAALEAGSGRLSDVSELVVPQQGQPEGSPTAGVLGTWCSSSIPGCEHSLAGGFPAQYRSFAWAGPGQPYGTRIVTGLDHRRLLELGAGEVGQSFVNVVGAGGDVGGAPGGAAFEAPRPGVPAQGWIADAVNPNGAIDGAGQSQAIAVTPHAEGDLLQEEAVPFRRPLYALAQAPGSTPGSVQSEALAVGEEGEVARYVPGKGWRSEALENSSGVAQTPTLRGVAWPEPGRAYAVGDSGAMWLWRAETGLWEPDPAKPFNFIGNLTAIAFSPSNPSIGYAVGRQGALLRYGKSWEQEPTCGPGVPPPCMHAELADVNFTSITFAGTEALATYRVVVGERGGSLIETGGIAIEDGAGWQPDPGATALLEQLPAQQRVLSRIAGLPDGGVVAAGPEKVIERDAPSAPWRFSPQPLPEAQNVSALAAYRDSSGSVRAIVSIDLDEYLNPANFTNIRLENGPFAGDVPPSTQPGQPTPFLGPELLPNSGYVLKETASGWSDMEHFALPAPSGRLPLDMPTRPDPVLALIASANGETGLAVGGETGNFEGRGAEAAYETSAAMRFPAGQAASDGTVPATVPTAPGRASFAIGGEATCVDPCADYANDGIGPSVWLEHALQTSSSIAAHSPGGLRAFLYSGSDVGESALSQDIGAFAGPPTVYAANTGAAEPGTTPGPSGTGAYSALSEGAGGPVELIALGFEGGALQSEPAQLVWLTELLAQARTAGTPAIVMGSAALGAELPDELSGQRPQPAEPAASAALAQALVQGGASAYFFGYPGSNMKTTVTYGTAGIPAYGTGTLGYVRPPLEGFQADSLGSSGFLVAEVETAARNATTNVAPVSVRVVPNIGQLALDATDGLLLRRSATGLFEALARRSLGGASIREASTGVELLGPSPYDPIPHNCQGPNCAYEVPTEYTFTSSNPDIGDFVAHDDTSNDPRQVELGANKLPIADSHSGLFCAYNEGTTIVSITTGGLTYSEPVTVQGGSVEYPCGTVPLKNPPLKAAPASTAVAVPNLAPSNAPPVNPTIQTVPPPPPPVPAKSPPPVHHARPPVFIPFQPLLPAAVVAPLAIVPPISPPVARPIPPSGTAQVTQGAYSPESERERETAGELASSEFSAYDPNEGGWMGPSIVALVILAAGAGVGIRGGARRRRQLPAIARARSEPRTQAKRGRRG